MGIVHFACLGASPGAVTAGLSYLAHNREANRFLGSFRGEAVEGLVLFGPTDLRNTPCVINPYGMTHGQGKGWRENESKPQDIIRQFCQKNLAGADPVRLYHWPVDPHSYTACLEAMAKAAMALSANASDDTGKNIWVNLTGGTNVMNGAEMALASLSGLVARVYYLFVPTEEHRQYMQPFTEDENYFRWEDVPVFKQAFDSGYYALLQTVQAAGPIAAPDLLSRLKGDDQAWQYFSETSLDALRARFLNKMDSRELFRSGDTVRLSPQGEFFLRQLASPVIQDLIHCGQGGGVETERYVTELKEKLIS